MLLQRIFVTNGVCIQISKGLGEGADTPSHKNQTSKGPLETLIPSVLVSVKRKPIDFNIFDDVLQKETHYPNDASNDTNDPLNKQAAL